MIIASICNSTNFIIPSKEKLTRYKITVSAGAGLDGEGINGGLGGFGEVKEFYFLTKDKVIIDVVFFKIAQDGMSNYCFLGGKAGFDILCKISADNNTKELYCKAGAGGGAGGDTKNEILLGSNGGGYKDIEGGKSSFVYGGKGVDGPECFYNEKTRKNFCPTLHNKSSAVVLIEEF